MRVAPVGGLSSDLEPDAAGASCDQRHVSFFSGHRDPLPVVVYRFSGPLILRTAGTRATPFSSALVAPGEERGACCGDGHEHDGRHGTHLKPFTEDDEAGERGHGRLQAHQDAEDAGGDLA